MIPYLFVLLPILAYLPLFGFETFVAFKRLGKNNKYAGEYLHVTWEMTHTLLIVGVNYFIWLFASIIADVGKAVYWGLITAGALYIVRAILYLKLFYSNESKKNKLLGWLFAITHLLIVVCLLYVVIRAAIVMFTNQYTINTQFIPWMWPGLIFMVIICSVPIVQLYKTTKK